MTERQIRKLLTGSLGWSGALCFAGGLIAIICAAPWGGKVATFGLGLCAAASEADPDARLPWPWRVSLSALTALGALTVA